MLSTSKKVHDHIVNEGIDSDFYSVPIIDACFEEEIKKISRKYKWIFTIEEHLSILGFGSIIKKYLELENSRVVSFGIDHSLNKEVGSQNYLREIAGLNCHDLSDKIISIYKNHIK